MSKPFFSIVIPTLNEEKFLPHLLADLHDQSFPHELFEVIHVDGHSDDQTVAEAAKFSHRLDLKTLTAKKRNVSHQRNLGAAAATGQWVIFMDADNRLPHYFLDGIKYQLAKHPTVDIFTTWSQAKSLTSVEGSITQMLNIGLEIYNSSGKPAAFGAMIGVKKVFVNKISFDETQKFMEDTFFVKAVCDAGGTFKIFQEPRYTFSLRRFEKEGSLKFVSNGALLQLKYLQGQDFKDEANYKMIGGEYYDQISPSLFRNVISQVKKMPMQQLKFARKLLKTINKELGI